MDEINDFLNHLKSLNYALNTIRTYKSALSPLQKHYLQKITTADLEVILKRSRNTATAASRLSTLKTFFIWAIEHDLILNNPTNGLKPAKQIDRLPTPIPENDLKMIFDFIDRLPLAEQTYFYLIRYLALKPTEALRLRVEIVNLHKGMVEVSTAYSKRYVPISNSDLATKLRSLCREQERGPLFISNRCQRASYYWAYRRWRQIMQQTGQDFTLEQLRQTCIIEWLNNGITPKTVARWVGGLNSMYDIFIEEDFKCN